MADSTAPEPSTRAKGMSLEELAELGPLPGVVADDEEQGSGDHSNDRVGQGKSVVLPGPSSNNAVR